MSISICRRWLRCWTAKSGEQEIEIETLTAPTGWPSTERTPRKRKLAQRINMTEWQKVRAEIDAVDAAIEDTMAERLAWAYANTTGWRLRELGERRAALDA